MKKLGATTLQELTAIKKCSACQYIKSHLWLPPPILLISS
jgi:hypothetical protein